MQTGSNKSLFVLLTIVIFGIFLSISYWFFADQFSVVLADVFFNVSQKTDSFDFGTSQTVTINGNSYKDYDEYYNTFTPTDESLFTYTDNLDGTCTITQYIGSDKNVIVPKEIDGLTVTRIGDMAFVFLHLSEFIIPNTVVSIGYLALSGNELTNLYIPDSVTYIDWAAFQSSDIQNLYISKNINFIGHDAFSFNKLKTLDVPTTISTIPENCFAGNELTYVYIPNNITTIEMYAFSSNFITNVDAPSNLETQIQTGIDVFGFQNPTFNYY